MWSDFLDNMQGLAGQVVGAARDIAVAREDTRQTNRLADGVNTQAAVAVDRQAQLIRAGITAMVILAGVYLITREG